MLYVGVDVHRIASHITVMDPAGKILMRKHVPSTPAGVHEALGGYSQQMKGVLEASGCWDPMHDWLAEIADDVVLAHPAKVRAIADADQDRPN